MTRTNKVRNNMSSRGAISLLWTLVIIVIVVVVIIVLLRVVFAVLAIAVTPAGLESYCVLTANHAIVKASQLLPSLHSLAKVALH